MIDNLDHLMSTDDLLYKKSAECRKLIAEKTIDSYGVILIVEGPDAKENKNATISI